MTNKFHSLTDDLIVGLLENDQNAQVFLYTSDESINITAQRLQSAKFRADQHQQAARDWLSGLVNSERLILADRHALPPQAPALEQWIKSIRSMHPKRSLIVFVEHDAEVSKKPRK